MSTAEESLVGGDVVDLFADIPEAEQPPADEPVGPPPVLAEDGGAEPDSDADLFVRAKKFVFQALFEKAAQVVPTKDILPVLKNFLLEANPGEIRVVATDLELSVISTTEMVTVERAGLAVFNAKKMLEIIREAADDDMAIDVKEGVATITCGRTTWTLKLQSGDDYPPLPDTEDVKLHVTDRVKFLGAVQSVRGAAATDTTRQNLMMIDVQGGKMTACDGVRFQQAKIDKFPLSIQIPIGAVDDLVKLLRTTDLEEIGVGETENHLVFKVGRDVFIANKLLAQFPDMEALLLQPALRNTEKLVVDRSELVDVIKRVRINADPEASAIQLKLEDNTVKVETKDKLDNGSTESLNVSWTSDERLVVVNHRFLLEMLQMYDGATCNFFFGEDKKTRKLPIMLRDEDTGHIGVIQQMRPDWTVS